MLVVGGLLIYSGVRIATVQMGFSPDSELTEPWLSDVAEFREVLYADRPLDLSRPTVWVVAGSNALFGTDSRTLKESLGVNVRNYALHRGLHPDFWFSAISEKVRAGDVVVAPIEFGAVQRPLGSQSDFANYAHHMHGWLKLSIQDQYRLLTSVPLSRWWSGFFGYLASPSQDAGRVPVNAMRKYWQEYVGPRSYYSFISLTRYGDINVDEPMAPATWEGDEQLEVVPIGRQGAEILGRWAKEFQAKGVAFFLTSPVLLEDRFGTISSPSFWASFERYRAELQEINVPLHCSPTDAILAKVYRLDTIYHPNALGARVRSIALANCLKGFLAGGDSLTLAVDPSTMAGVAADMFRAQNANPQQASTPAN